MVAGKKLWCMLRAIITRKYYGQDNDHAAFSFNKKHIMHTYTVLVVNKIRYAGICPSNNDSMLPVKFTCNMIRANV
jgi:hypothetical protein